jgi:hypothetical protein
LNTNGKIRESYFLGHAPGRNITILPPNNTRKRFAAYC